MAKKGISRDFAKGLRSENPPEIERVFFCDHCCVEFQIRIEPGKELNAIIRHYPDSIEWLRSIDEAMCPHCGWACESR